ncbi:hypothetical protein VNI00_016143 [Paramarasmius palmivorus]|uniref:Uncharacterized protein n=1 Tax=Paramarasmius palmivorus TaxID=297713 RepID=A0AAW0BG29_9AGAR
MNLGGLLMFVSTFIFVVIFVQCVPGFSIVAPPAADVDLINNIAGNWTWSEGDPTKVIINLYVNGEDVCIFGIAKPMESQDITRDIQRANEVDGKKNGTVIHQADKTGDYILCAFEDVSANGKLNLTSIANSSVFSVSRLPIVQTTTVLGTSSSLNPTSSNSGLPIETDIGSKPSQGLSTGIIAGIVIGAASLAALMLAVLILFRRIRRRGNSQDVPAESIISPYSHLVSTGTPMAKGHGSPVQVEEEQRENQRERRVLYHNDSGWRPPSQSDAGISSVLEMPPSYRSAL